MRRESRPQTEAAIPEDTGRVLSTILSQPTHNGTTDTLLPEFTPEAAANVVPWRDLPRYAAKQKRAAEDAQREAKMHYLAREDAALETDTTKGNQ